MVRAEPREFGRLFSLQWRHVQPDWDGAGEIFKLSPHEWLIKRETAHPALIEVTEAYRCFAVLGPQAVDLMAKGTSLDLHPRAFPARSWARCLMAQIPAIIRAVSEGTDYEVYVDVSYARYFALWLDAAARELA